MVPNTHYQRDWSKFSDDEIFAIWKSYQRTEFPGYGNMLGQCSVQNKPIRLTPMEIFRLVDELIDRLEVKEHGKQPDA